MSKYPRVCDAVGGDLKDGKIFLKAGTELEREPRTPINRFDREQNKVAVKIPLMLFNFCN